MMVNVKYFGMIAEHLGLDHESINLTSDDLNLRKLIEDRHPYLKQLTYQIAVDQNMTENISAGQKITEIALLPPFAGG